MPRNAEIGATRNSAVYPIRLPADLKQAWAAHCEKKGQSQQALIRALMRYIIQDDMPPEVRRWIAEQTEGEPDDGPKERLEVRFTPTEFQGINARAEAEGCSPQRWVINCVRASLTHEPQFTMETTKALWESSYQLRAIGRNLNQIAKRLNEGKPANIKTEQIEKLATYIYRHTDKVAAVQDASLSRWGIQLEGAANGA
ncbi:plasmid mobilization relaxosome protein MobC [Shigella flexneri]